MFFASSDFGESYVLEVVALVIIGFILYRYVAPPIRKAMANRLESIRSQLAAGDEARAQTEQLVTQRRASLDAARDEAKSIVEQAQRSAGLLVEDGQRRSAQELDRLVAHASTQIELLHNRMRDELTTEMSALVISGAQRIVDAELDEPRHHRLIDESIGAVESEASA